MVHGGAAIVQEMFQQVQPQRDVEMNARGQMSCKSCDTVGCVASFGSYNLKIGTIYAAGKSSLAYLPGSVKIHTNIAGFVVS